MKKVKFTLSIGYVGAEHKTIVEFPDDVTEEQIEEEYQCWCANYLDGGWYELDDDEGDENDGP